MEIKNINGIKLNQIKIHGIKSKHMVDRQSLSI